MQPRDESRFCDWEMLCAARDIGNNLHTEARAGIKVARDLTLNMNNCLGMSEVFSAQLDPRNGLHVDASMIMNDYSKMRTEINKKILHAKKVYYTFQRKKMASKFLLTMVHRRLEGKPLEHAPEREGEEMAVHMPTVHDTAQFTYRTNKKVYLKIRDALECSKDRMEQIIAHYNRAKMIYKLRSERQNLLKI